MSKTRDQGTLTLCHAGHLLVLAKRSFERMGSYTSESEITIILSTLALEAFVNELAYMGDSLSSENIPEEIKAFHSLMHEAESSNAQIGLKIQLAYYALTRKTVDKGALPYQDFDSLIKLRNALAHPKPITVPLDSDGESDYEHCNIVKRLVDRKVIGEPPNHPLPWRQLLVVPEVAAWSYNVAVQVIRWLVSSIPPSYLRKVADVQIATLEEIHISHFNAGDKSV